VPHSFVSIHDMSTVKQLAEQYVKDGYEGIMLKDPKSAHWRRRHPGILKAKTVASYDLKIDQVQEGLGKYKNTLGALVLKSANNKVVKVGSGISDKQRDELWKNRESLIGKIVEVSAQEVTKNSLRFPVFVKLRDDKDEPDAI